MDQIMNTPVDTEAPTPALNPAYVSIPLANDPGLLSLLSSWIDYLGADAASAWQAPSTWHVSLCFSPDIDDKKLKKVIAALEPRPVDLQVAGLNVFATPNGYALHLALKRTESLMDLQIKVYNAFVLAGAECSDYHTPESFNPHITLGYFIDNPVQKFDPGVWFMRRTAALEVSRAEYQRVALLGDDASPWRFIERFSAINPDAWFRILPVGIFERFGRKVVVTLETVLEMAANFKAGIPNTVLPINAEHADTEGKLGDIADVEARPDGLYMLPRWLDDGRKKVADGRFSYFSPEIVWSSDYDGSPVQNVLVGLALTNLPFFGKETAIYSAQDFVNHGASKDVSAPDIESYQGGSTLSDINKTPDVRQTVKETLMELFGLGKPESVPPAAPAVTEEFRALQTENAELKAQAEAQRLIADEAKKQVRVNHFKALLGDGFDAQAEKFAAIADEKLADELAEQFKALKAQANPALFGELGSSTPSDSGASSAEKFNAEAQRLAAEQKIDLADAYELVGKQHPDWAKEARMKSGRRQ